MARPSHATEGARGRMVLPVISQVQGQRGILQSFWRSSQETVAIFPVCFWRLRCPTCSNVPPCSKPISAWVPNWSILAAGKCHSTMVRKLTSTTLCGAMPACSMSRTCVRSRWRVSVRPRFCAMRSPTILTNSPHLGGRFIRACSMSMGT